MTSYRYDTTQEKLVPMTDEEVQEMLRKEQENTLAEPKQVMKEEALNYLHQLLEWRGTEVDEADFLWKYHIGQLATTDSFLHILEQVRMQKPDEFSILEPFRSFDDLAEDFANDELSSAQDCWEHIQANMHAYDTLSEKREEPIIS